MNRIQPLKMLMVAAAIVTPIYLMALTPSLAAKPVKVAACNVGSPSYPTILSAVVDTNCDSINVPAGTFRENVAILDFDRDVTIRGAGPGSTIVDGSNREAPVFAFTNPDLSTNPVPHAITLKGMTITGGTSPRAQFPNGGGIAVFGVTLTVKDCLITSNKAPDYFVPSCIPDTPSYFRCIGQGGGIGAAQSTVFVTDSIITENSATYGGGLRVAGIGSLTVTDSVIEGNRASNDGGLGQGGGIYGNAPSLGTMTIKDSLITENIAGTQGGGIYVNSRALTLKDSTITHNEATQGGGIYLSSSTLTVKDSTITDNTPDQIAP